MELAGGGNAKFRAMIDRAAAEGGGWYSPFSWTVRHFGPGIVSETVFEFTPNGSPHGFITTLSEDEASTAKLTLAEARQVAVLGAAAAPWGLDLLDSSAFELVEEKNEVKVGGREDFIFVYERVGARINSTNFGEAEHRVELGVAGDQFSALSHYLKVPEKFHRVRSSRNDVDRLSLAFVRCIL